MSQANLTAMPSAEALSPEINAWLATWRAVPAGESLPESEYRRLAELIRSAQLSSTIAARVVIVVRNTAPHDFFMAPAYAAIVDRAKQEIEAATAASTADAITALTSIRLHVSRSSDECTSERLNDLILPHLPAASDAAFWAAHMRAEGILGQGRFERRPRRLRQSNRSSPGRN